MFPTRIPGIDVVNMRVDKEQNEPPLNFPAFGDFLIPVSAANGNCRTIEEFTKEGILKEDITDVVCKYKDTKNESFTVVEHKKIKDLNEELKDLLRELKILRDLNHHQCLKFLGIAVERKDLTTTYLIFEPLNCYLSDENVIEKDVLYEEDMIRDTMGQILSAMSYLEEKSIMHRNLHPGNIGIDNNGVLKITNFREARYKSDEDKTIWSPEFRYQAPELLMSTRICGPPVDVWSAACIFAQLLLRELLFKDNDLEIVLADIFGMFGMPTERIWPGFFKLPEYDCLVIHTEKPKYNQLELHFDRLGRTQPDSTMELLQCMFLYDPERRYTAKDCLKHPFFAKEDEDVDGQMEVLSIGSSDT